MMQDPWTNQSYVACQMLVNNETKRTEWLINEMKECINKLEANKQQLDIYREQADRQADTWSKINLLNMKTGVEQMRQEEVGDVRELVRIFEDYLSTRSIYFSEYYNRHSKKKAKSKKNQTECGKTINAKHHEDTIIIRMPRLLSRYHSHRKNTDMPYYETEIREELKKYSNFFEELFEEKNIKWSFSIQYVVVLGKKIPGGRVADSDNLDTKYISDAIVRTLGIDDNAWIMSFSYTAIFNDKVRPGTYIIIKPDKEVLLSVPDIFTKINLIFGN